MASNPLNPPSFTLSGEPSGIYGYQFPSSDYVLYGNPFGPGVYTITVTASNIAGSDSRDLVLTVNAPAFQVDNAPDSQFNGLYTRAEDGFYEYDFNTLTVQYNSAFSTIGLTSVWRNQNNSNLAIFYYQTYDAWILADTTVFAGNPPDVISPNATNDSSPNPPEFGWSSTNNAITVTRVPAP